MKPAEKIEDHPGEKIPYFKERYFSVYIATRQDECGMCKTGNCLTDMES